MVIKAGDLRVGMIIKVKINERIPADLLLLNTW
jgi:magnesium-transporting ATPase (P-type)